MMTESMQKYLDSCKNSNRGKILKALSDLNERTGFDSASPDCGPGQHVLGG